MYTKLFLIEKLKLAYQYLINYSIAKQLNGFYVILFIIISCISNLQAQTIFDWESNITDNGSTIQQTLNGITATFTLGTNNPQIVNANGFAGTIDNIVSSRTNENTYATFTFSSPINITSIYAVEGISTNNIDETWTFTPTGGNNSSVSVIIPGYNQANSIGVNVFLNWTNASEIKVTSSGPDVWFSFDNIVSQETFSSIDNYQRNKTSNLFPNPSSDYIIIDNVFKIEHYKIYNIMGGKVVEGNAFKNEKIDIRYLDNGAYILKMSNGHTAKFIKQ
jgi:hypothetical protein